MWILQNNSPVSGKQNRFANIYGIDKMEFLMRIIFSIHCSAVIGLAIPIAMVVVGDQNRWVDQSIQTMTSIPLDMQ